MTLRIAMWSGPRNVSTALMRSFDARSDTRVCDEPLYAHYLQETGLPHPLAEEVMEEHDCDWKSVTNWLTQDNDPKKPVFYQKHMAHHLLPHIGREWLQHLTNVFLIRSPRAMLRSLLQVWSEPCIEDTGLPQQVRLFEDLRTEKRETPLVVDSEVLLRDPRSILTALCQRLGIPFEDSMLAWSPGSRTTDGCWAPAWYANVERSTGFLPYQPANAELPAKWEGLALECEQLYSQMRPFALTS